MAAVRITFGRLLKSKTDDLQAISFDARQWSKRTAKAWLQMQGFDARKLEASPDQYRYTVRARNLFVPGTLRTVRTDGWEKVTMASNPKSRKKQRRAKAASKRRVKKNRRASPKKRTTAKRRAPAKRRAKSKRRAVGRGKAKTTHTKLTSVKVVRTNARPKKPAGAPRARGATRFTVAFTPAAARIFVRVARLSKARMREMRRSLRRHPTGGVYVSLPDWHGSKEQAQRLANRVQLVLAYAAGRRRATLGSASVPRVVAVP